MTLITTLFLMEQYGPRLNIEQLSKALGIAPNTILIKVGRGEFEIPTYIDGKMRYADTRDVAEYLDKKRAEAKQQLAA